jgi:peptidoglycan/xylan/chitin deacetylase (PgdA/CDA1 family)
VRTARFLGLAGLAAQWGPALTSIGPLRRRVMPKLAGIASSADVALTYDDGPDPKSTPHFLDLLASYDVSATFFLLGSALAGNATLVKEMAAAGHELAVHGWDHQCLAWKRPGLLADELRRTQHTLEDMTGAPVTRYRPPYGVMTGEGLLAARRTQLRTVLWSAWGETGAATPRPGPSWTRSTQLSPRAGRCCSTTPTEPPLQVRGAPPSTPPTLC